MRQLDPVSNLVLCALAAAGLLATLSLPWFANPVVDTTDTDGPIEKGAFQVSHFFSHGVNQVTGTNALGSSKSILFIVVAAILGLAGAVTVPQLRRQAEDLLRMVAFAPPIAVLGLAVAHQGTHGPVKAHWGILVSFAVASFACSCAYHGANMRNKRKQTAKPLRISAS